MPRRRVWRETSVLLADPLSSERDRLVERRLAAVLFDDADPAGAVDAVLTNRNPDGGFGHGLEPTSGVRPFFLSMWSER
jgi:hypothetical protein